MLFMKMLKESFEFANSNRKIYEVKNNSAFQVLGIEKLSSVLNKE